jgi:hypothetical protein
VLLALHPWRVGLQIAQRRAEIQRAPPPAPIDLGFEYDGQRTDCMSGISVGRVADEALERARA